MTLATLSFRAGLVGLGLMLLATPEARADILDIGVMSLDVLIPPAGASPGVNVFDIYNFTGDPSLSGYALPPDFPVLTFVTLEDVSILFNGAGSPVILPDIAPGQLDRGSAPQFAGDVRFTSALFTAILSDTSLSSLTAPPSSPTQPLPQLFYRVPGRT
jgi:hypothetical protein